MVDVNFKPSQVRLIEPVPFIGTFGKVESECAAGFLVLAMRHFGDKWESVFPPDCGVVLHNHHGKPGYSWLANPFCRPDFPLLIERGFAEFTGEDTGRGQPIAFTDAGLDAMRKWVMTDDT